MRAAVAILLLAAGAARAQDAGAVYRLPWDAGKAHRCTQSHNGTTSHTGRTRYAVDFSMPEGTTVRAARGGKVTKAVDDEPANGEHGKYGAMGNHVVVDHGDGTTGVYMHLAPGGTLVAVGEWIAPGDPIARSGNTGLSTGPHLHFEVDDAAFQTIPIRFAEVETDDGVPASGRDYTSANVPAIPPAVRERLTALARAASIAAAEGHLGLERRACDGIARTSLAIEFPPIAQARARVVAIDEASAAHAGELRAAAAGDFEGAVGRLLLARPVHAGLPGEKPLRELEVEWKRDPRFAAASREAGPAVRLLEGFRDALRDEIEGRLAQAGRGYAALVRRDPGGEVGKRAAARLAAVEAALAGGK